MAIDWLMLKSEYLRTGVSLRALAAQHGVGHTALERQAAAEGWAAARHAAASGGNRNAAGRDMDERARGDPGTYGGVHAAARAMRAGGREQGKRPPMGDAPPEESAKRRSGADTGENGCPDKRSGGTAAQRGRAGQGKRTTAPVGASTAAKATGTKRNRGRGAAGAANPTRRTPAAEPPALVDADTIVRLRAISGQLTDQLAIAATQLDQQVVLSNRSAAKPNGGRARPCADAGSETDAGDGGYEIVKTLVSCEKLQRLASTLKNLNEIVKTGGGDEQSVGMVAALMKKLDDEAAKGDA